MKIMRTYTLRCLKRNKIRTLVTIIGIILSVALFTAVVEGAYSGQQYLIRSAEASSGSFHAYYSGMTADQLSELRSNSEVDRIGTLGSLGWAVVSPEQRSFPYLYIRSMSPELEQLLPITLTEGRMPENDRELVLPDSLEEISGTPRQIGQTLTLEVGKRQGTDGRELFDEDPYQQGKEQLGDTREHTYTVVGLYHRLPRTIDAISLPGDIALTGETPCEHTTAYFTLHDVNRIHSFLAEHPFENTSYMENRDLLLFSGASGNRSVVRVLYSLVAILFGMILFGSVALIYNSFSISVSERTKQFGLLKSIGATKKQIRGAVISEALMLCVIAIPLGLLVGCAGIGLTLYLLRDEFSLISFASDVKVQIGLVPNLPALLAAAVTGLITAVISAWIPARRAMAITPIDAIRQSKDLIVSKREIKTSKLTQRLFGFSGVLASKNYKRNRKRYRATVLSLFMSVVLFISASSFSGYLRNDVRSNANHSSFDLCFTLNLNAVTEMTPEALLRELRQAEGVTEAAYAKTVHVEYTLPSEALSQQAPSYGMPEDYSDYAALYFLPDDTYRALCAKEGLNAEDAPVLIYDNLSQLVFKEDRNVYVNFDLLASFPTELTLHPPKTFDGYEIYDSRYDENDQLILIYYPTDENGVIADADPSLRIEVPEAEAYENVSLTASARLSEQPMISESGMAGLYLPLSAEAELLSDRLGNDVFYFRSSNHSRTSDALNEQAKALGLSDHCDVWDAMSGEEETRAMLMVLDVFTFGFIALISLIAAANVFNTISTNVMLRRRELATLRSVGMDRKAFGRMMRFECLLYGSKALLYGLPAAFVVTWLIYKAVTNAFETSFRIPWGSVLVAVASVFLVVFATMLYAMHKVNSENTVETLRNETI